jgi:hypothetical protein
MKKQFIRPLLIAIIAFATITNIGLVLTLNHSITPNPFHERTGTVIFIIGAILDAIVLLIPNEPKVDYGKMQKNIDSLTEKYNILLFIIDNPPAFKKGDKIDRYTIMSHTEHWDKLRGTAYRKYLSFDEQIHTTAEAEESYYAGFRKKSTPQ